ncbi:excisionase family DNA-binding protein [Brachybacterium alimentarium]|uniref:excisionase family DNA-binding protein n=1 Tax=Brachybacterium alimentarium TaxID=47845 RepID=UPI001C6A841B|nr:helix-turn-helix domain-containing protein [Brachybacterium alimentarium]
MPERSSTRAARYMSQQSAAEYADCTVRTIRNLIARGDLTGYRLGARSIRVDRAELDALLVPIPTAGDRR